MFKKPLQLNNRTTLKSSAARKFIEFIQKTFPTLNEHDISLLFPSKCTISVDKLSQPIKNCLLYWHEKDKPLFIDVQQHPAPPNHSQSLYAEFGVPSNIFPTVYTAWLVPHILFSIISAAPVSKFIISNGADLMLPGLFMPKLLPSEQQLIFQWQLQRQINSQSQELSPGQISRENKEIETKINSQKSSEQAQKPPKANLFADYEDEPSAPQRKLKLPNKSVKLEENSEEKVEIEPEIIAPAAPLTPAQRYYHNTCHWKAGDKRLLLVQGNSMAFAVGEMLIDSHMAIKQDMKGKAMKIMHYYGDSIYLQHDRSIPNAGFLPHEVFPTVTQADLEEFVSKSEQNQEIKQQNVDTSIENRQIQRNNDNSPIESAETAPDKAENNSDANKESAEISLKQLNLAEAAGNIASEPAAEAYQQEIAQNSFEIKETPAESSAASGGNSARDDAGSGSENDEKLISPSEMDDSLRKSLYFAVKTRLSAEELPLSGSKLFSHMLAASIFPWKLEIKRSSYKKMQKFIKEMAKTGVIKAKLMQNELFITSFDPESAEIKGLAVDKQYFAALKQKNKQSKQKSEENQAETHHLTGTAKRERAEMKILLAYKPDSSVRRYLFDEMKENEIVAGNESGFWQLKDAKQLLWDYIKAKSLDAGQQVKLDDNLFHALYGSHSNKSIDSLVSKAEISKQFDSHMQLYHSIVLDGDLGHVKYSKGNVANIVVSTERRAGNRYMSKIKGLELFGIDCVLFAKEAARIFSASATVAESIGNTKEVLVQGNITGEIANKLHEMYKIPPQYVSIQANSTTKKK
jgi:translation initiation factor 2D